MEIGTPEKAIQLSYIIFFAETVRDLEFSSNGQRTYDSNGTVCNVWELDVLIRHKDTGQDDISRNNESNNESSILSDPGISHDSAKSQVAELMVDSKDQYHCCGGDDGSAAIH